jgi:hypothetical protein
VFASFHKPASSDYTVTVALLTAAFVFIPALVAISQPVSYWLPLAVSTVCVILAFFHSRQMQRATIAPPVVAQPVTQMKAAK